MVFLLIWSKRTKGRCGPNDAVPRETFTECFDKLDMAIVSVLALSSKNEFDCSEMRAEIVAASRSPSSKGNVIVYLKHFQKAEFYPVCGIEGFLASKHCEAEYGELNREKAVDIIRGIQINITPSDTLCRIMRNPIILYVKHTSQTIVQNLRHGSIISTNRDDQYNTT